MPTLGQVPAVPPPSVPFGGSIGPGGKFPLFNGGTVTMADADTTLQWPGFSASVIRVTGTLTVVHTLYAPSNQFGFEYTIQNATAGGFAILVKPEGNAAAAGVSIPNGETRMVIFDGINYVVAGGGGSGGGTGNEGIMSIYNVPLTHSPIQAAVDASAASKSGPVLIAPSYVGTDSYTNTGASGVDVADYRTRFNNQSPAFQPIELDQKFGLVPDGKWLYNCTVQSGSPNVVCGGAGFTAADVGKLAVCYGCGVDNGLLGDAGTVSGGTGGKANTYQEVFLTDGGCTTQPRGIISINASGVPVGAVTMVDNGAGCTSVPTQATVQTVTGPVSFSGGTIGRDNLTTTIVGFVDANTVTLGQNAGQTGARFLGYGTDNLAGFQRYANSYGGNESQNALRTSWGIINGTYFISGCVDFARFNGRLSGTGRGSQNGGSGAIIAYAGTTFHDCMFDIRDGLDSRIERIHFFGNSQFQPDALRFTHVSTNKTGTAINAYHYIDQNVFGIDYTASGPDYWSGKYNIWHGIHALTDIGNVDFFYLPTNRVNKAEIAVEVDNPNITLWNFGTWWATYNGVGFNCSAQCVVGVMAMGHNKTDIEIGMETPPSGGTGAGTSADLQITNFASEASNQMLKLSRVYPPATWKVDIRRGSYQIVATLVPSENGVRKVVDFSQTPGWPQLIMENFTFYFAPPFYSGPEDWVIYVGAAGQCYNTVPMKFNRMAGLNPFRNIKLMMNTSCAADIQSQPFEFSSANEGGPPWASIKSYPRFTSPNNLFTQEQLGTSVDYGLLKVAPVGTMASYLAAGVTGTAGTTDYQYKVAAVVGNSPDQYESAAVLISNITTGNATLTTTNKIWMGWPMVKGASSYHVYRSLDAGVTWQCLAKAGAPSCYDFTFMDKVSTPYPYGGLGISFFDDGSWTYRAAYPNIVDQTGAINASHYWLNGLPFGVRQLANWDGSTVAQNEFVFVSTPDGKIGSGMPTTWTTGTTGNSIPTITAGGVAGQIGYSTVASGQLAQIGTAYVIGYPYRAPANATVTDIKVNLGGSTTTSNGYGLIYDSDGVSSNGAFPYDGAGGLLCASALTPIAPGLITFTMPPGCKLSQSHYYYLALMALNAPYLNFDNIVPAGNVLECSGYTAAVIPQRMDRSVGYGCGSTYRVPTIYADTLSTPAPGPLINLAGSGVSCVQADATGMMTRTGSACGTSGSTSGTFAAGGDLSGTDTSQQVIGIRGVGVPSLGSGYLRYNGAAFSWASTLVGPVQLPLALANQASLATDASGNIIAGQSSSAQIPAGISYDSNTHGWQAGGTVSISASNVVTAAGFRYGLPFDTTFSSIGVSFTTATTSDIVYFAIYDFTARRLICHTEGFNPAASPSIASPACVEPSPRLEANHDYIFMRSSSVSTTIMSGLNSPHGFLRYTANVQAICPIVVGTGPGTGITTCPGTFPAWGSTYIVGVSVPHFHLE